MNYKVYNSDNKLVNTVFASEQFIEQYCKVNGYTYKVDEYEVNEYEEELDPQADTDAMMVDHEYRLTLLELGIIE